MPKRTAAERYATRKQRVAADLRVCMLAAAGAGAHHARLRARYGPDWRGMLGRALQRQLDEWHNIVDINPSRLTDTQFRNYYQNRSFQTPGHNPYRPPGDPEYGYYDPAAREAFLRYTGGGGVDGV